MGEDLPSFQDFGATTSIVAITELTPVYSVLLTFFRVSVPVN
jgi:hypothetical protein